MALKGNNGGGRRSKGERHLVATRLPIVQARELSDRADAEGVTVTDYVARVLGEYLAANPVRNPHQEALDISA
jgi:hypothetical protein